MVRINAAILIVLLFFMVQCSACVNASDQIPTSAPLTTDSAGKTHQLALGSIFRVICKINGKAGTAFLHKSGKIITAAHVVEGCEPTDLIILGAKLKPTAITNMILDRQYDIALLTPKTKINADALEISSSTGIRIGSQVATWGYPAGYGGLAPLLSVGYMSGMDTIENRDKSKARRWVVNAAFNSGNSGGPLVDIENGDVVGVVCSKLAPMPETIENAIKALSKGAGGGFVYQYPVKVGETEKLLLEGQIVGMVLDYLRRQTQLVIGHAVLLSDLRGFIKSQGIAP